MRNINPDSPENQRQTLDNQRAVFAAQMQHAQRQHDAEEPEPETCNHFWRPHGNPINCGQVEEL